jgi:hypothetical protein
MNPFISARRRRTDAPGVARKRPREAEMGRYEQLALTGLAICSFGWLSFVSLVALLE